MSLYAVAVTILVVIYANKHLGGSNGGLIAQTGLWFALGVLSAPLILLLGFLMGG